MNNERPNYLVIFPTYNQLSFVYNEISYQSQLGNRKVYRDRHVIVYDWANVWFAVNDFLYSKLQGMRYEIITIYRPYDQPTISVDYLEHFTTTKIIRSFIVPEEVTQWLENIRLQYVNPAP